MDRSELDMMCEALAERVDPDTLVEVLGLSTEDLVEALRAHIAANMEALEELL